MLDSLLGMLQLLIVVLGAAGSTETAAFGGIAGALAITIVTLSTAAILLAALAMAHIAPRRASPPDPRRAIDVSCLLAQSDPDAAGHARPRAPQSAASAA